VQQRREKNPRFFSVSSIPNLPSIVRRIPDILAFQICFRTFETTLNSCFSGAIALKMSLGAEKNRLTGDFAAFSLF
jgi:hypothetical protein